MPGVPTADQVAVAIVRAAQICDVAPADVFGHVVIRAMPGCRRARILAGLGLVNAGMATPMAARRIFDLTSNAFAPSQVAAAKISGAMVAAVMAALERAFGQGDDPGDDPGGDPPAAIEPERAKPRRAHAAPALAAEPAPLRTPREPRASSREPKEAGDVVRLRPVSEAVLRYATWFVRARWPGETIAWLFDVEPDALRAALRANGVAAA